MPAASAELGMSAVTVAGSPFGHQCAGMSCSQNRFAASSHGASAFPLSLLVLARRGSIFGHVVVRAWSGMSLWPR